MSPRSSGPPRRRQRRDNPTEVYFDPEKLDVELFDVLAKRQANQLPERSVNSSQLRRFFGEIKDLYRQFQARAATVTDDDERRQIYRSEIEPRFKMVRSKVAYACPRHQRRQQKIPPQFADMLEGGIDKVRPGNHHDFETYVTHLEAVVGFMYGKGKVS